MTNFNYDDLLELQERACVETMPSNLETIVTRHSPSNHYRFLYFFIQKYLPQITVELGTQFGLSSLVMAQGNPNGIVHTIEISPYVGLDVNKDEPNIKEYVGSSIDKDIFNLIPNGIDLLLSDSNHDYSLTKTEYEMYLPKMNKGGIILFDDVLLFGVGADKFWNELNCEKLLLEKLHIGYGFGAVIV